MKSIFGSFLGLFRRKNKTRKPTLAVIDDCWMIQSAVRNAVGDVYKVTAFTLIPDDLSVLDAFDALVVDGSGIGNRTYPTGVDFLLAYAPRHPEKRFVHFTGYCDWQNRDSLAKLGIPVVDKGGRSGEILEALVQNGERE